MPVQLLFGPNALSDVSREGAEEPSLAEHDRCDGQLYRELAAVAVQCGEFKALANRPPITNVREAPQAVPMGLPVARRN